VKATENEWELDVPETPGRTKRSLNSMDMMQSVVVDLEKVILLGNVIEIFSCFMAVVTKGYNSLRGV